MGLLVKAETKGKAKVKTVTPSNGEKKPIIEFNVLTKEQVEAGRPKDAYSYIL